jgi:pyruvate/2-oxoglutarate dehydrogenase complex dihydrolipoamide acyltransferase (E2) component
MPAVREGNTVGVLSIILGLALFGVLADVVVENDLATTVHEPLTIVGTTQSISAPVIAIIAFAAGAFAVVLIVLGIRRLRHAGRKQLQERIRTLQDENARLHTQRNLQNIVRIPDAEPAPAPEAAKVESSSPPVPAEPTTAPSPAPAQPPTTDTRPDQPATKW